MASDVDICNLALSHLGDSATVASIDPPEGSAQAEHCARFYSLARDTLLEMHPWNFAVKRVALAALTSEWSEWDFCYAAPSDAITILAVLPPDVTDDYSALSYVTQSYSCEIDGDGAKVIYTDQEDATLRYVAAVTDSAKFSPLFSVALSWHLAEMLAGPIIKGDAVAAEAKRCAAMAKFYLDKAMASDANQRKSTPDHVVPWITAR